MSDRLLETRGLEMSFGGILAVHDFDFDMRAGELVCVIGPNGAGKSTLLNLLTGSMRPLAGTIAFEGEDVVGLPQHQFARRGIVRKFQAASTFPWLSVRDNLIVAGLGVAPLYGGDLPDVDEILELISLVPQADKLAHVISHGQRQWLEIGMALMCRPKLLLLDEPTAGMTVEGTRGMAALVRRLVSRLALVVVEHDMGFVRSLDCRTLVMHQGEIIREGRFADVTADRRVRDVYLGRH